MKVWVGVYSHRHGDDVFVYATEQLAQAARQSVAIEWWEREFNEPLPEDKDPEWIADEYFDRMDNEFFSIDECDVITA